jgi:hypothetical protein
MTQSKARDKQFVYYFNGRLMGDILTFDPSEEGGSIEFVRTLSDNKHAKDMGTPTIRIVITQDRLYDETLFPNWDNLKDSREAFTLSKARRDGAEEYLYEECYVSTIDDSGDGSANEQMSVTIVSKRKIKLV